MRTPGNTAKLGTAHSSIQTAQSCPSLVGSGTASHLVSILLSQRTIPLCQQFIYKSVSIIVANLRQWVCSKGDTVALK